MLSGEPASTAEGADEADSSWAVSGNDTLAGLVATYTSPCRSGGVTYTGRPAAAPCKVTAPDDHPLRYARGLAYRARTRLPPAGGSATATLQGRRPSSLGVGEVAVTKPSRGSTLPVPGWSLPRWVPSRVQSGTVSLVATRPFGALRRVCAGQTTGSEDRRPSISKIRSVRGFFEPSTEARGLVRECGGNGTSSMPVVLLEMPGLLVWTKTRRGVDTNSYVLQFEPWDAAGGPLAALG